MLSLLILGCHQDSAEQENRITDPERLARLRTLPLPEAFVRPQDQQAVRRLRSGYEAPMPCGDLDLNEHIDHCYRFEQPRRWKGVWEVQMEQSEFCPQSQRCSREFGERIWLDFSADEPGEARYPPGGTFAIEFIGRRNVLPGTFGHFGVYGNEVLVDRVISIRKIEAPPRQ